MNYYNPDHIRDEFISNKLYITSVRDISRFTLTN